VSAALAKDFLTNFAGPHGEPKYLNILVTFISSLHLTRVPSRSSFFLFFSQFDADFPLIPARCREPEDPSGTDRAGRPVPCTDSSPPQNQIPFPSEANVQCVIFGAKWLS
jgi:hypothetical protein